MALNSSYAEWDLDEFEAAKAEVTEKQRRAVGDNEFGDFFPGQPIGQRPEPPASPLRWSLTTAICLGIGSWGGLQIAEPVRPWLTPAIAYVKSEIGRHRVTVAPSHDSRPADLSEIATAAMPLSEAKIVADVPLSSSATPAPASSTEAPASKVETPVETSALAGQPDATPPSSTPAEEGAPLPKPEADPSDPLQKRALAAGLHPQLSKVLLSSLTDNDFRNAKTAVNRALAETQDAEKFVWPKDTKTKQAVFQVHFVPGAPNDCRRYVVTIIKNGWTTTARPMERCGAERAVGEAK